MTLTELKYIVAVAHEKHFGRAAETCFVSQPTLSLGVKKLEDELGIIIFERNANDLRLTPLGAQIIERAEQILEQAHALKELAETGRDPLSGPLRLGIIYTIAPYLLPQLVNKMIKRAPQMPLMLQENFTDKLMEDLRQGNIDAAIMALPLPEHSFATRALYEEPLVVAVPKNHRWAQRKIINADELKNETMLLLGNGHCFRDQVLEVCPGAASMASVQYGVARIFEGSSLETIRYMVASGIGITVLPHSSIPVEQSKSEPLHFLRFAEPEPKRRVIIAWRKSFPRLAAIDLVCEAVQNCRLHGVTVVTNEH